ncbi:bifunctional adenosylcobinamide kinase/adenosylcobinamide-phosphate guanylyltransferase, partial [Methylobacterium ajmalii]
PVLVDCLTLWLTNAMLDEEADLAAEVADLLAACAAAPGPLVLVSNEVGFGIVPENALARRFRDEAGRLHQRLAALADRVVLVVAGLPMTIKGETQ